MFKKLLGLEEMEDSLESLTSEVENLGRTLGKLQDDLLEVSDNLNHLISKVDALNKPNKIGRPKKK